MNKRRQRALPAFGPKLHDVTCRRFLKGYAMPYDRANAEVVGTLIGLQGSHSLRLVQLFAWFDVWQIEMDGKFLIEPEKN